MSVYFLPGVSWLAVVVMKEDTSLPSRTSHPSRLRKTWKAGNAKKMTSAWDSGKCGEKMTFHTKRGGISHMPKHQGMSWGL